MTCAALGMKQTKGQYGWRTQQSWPISSYLLSQYLDGTTGENHKYTVTLVSIRECVISIMNFSGPLSPQHGGPQVANSGDSLQMLREAAGMPAWGSTAAWGLDGGLTMSHHKHLNVM